MVDYAVPHITYINSRHTHPTHTHTHITKHNTTRHHSSPPAPSHTTPHATHIHTIPHPHYTTPTGRGLAMQSSIVIFQFGLALHTIAIVIGNRDKQINTPKLIDCYQAAEQSSYQSLGAQARLVAGSSDLAAAGASDPHEERVVAGGYST